MADGPNIARVAALLGDRARAEALTALLGGRALTATELAGIAGVTKPTMSAHLARLLDARLILVERQGRHRYFRLADEDVAALLESLMGVAFRTGALRLLPGPREPELRRARVCYDHLAGELGVEAYEALLGKGAFELAPEGLKLARPGREWFTAAGVDLEAAASRRRAFCCACLDWSERRQHLGGALGAALLARILSLGWGRRLRGSRVIAFAPAGERAFRSWLDGGGRNARRLRLG